MIFGLLISPLLYIIIAVFTYSSIRGNKNLFISIIGSIFWPITLLIIIGMILISIIKITNKGNKSDNRRKT
jgi:hypothetical protein